MSATTTTTELIRQFYISSTILSKQMIKLKEPASGKSFFLILESFLLILESFLLFHTHEDYRNVSLGRVSVLKWPLLGFSCRIDIEKIKINGNSKGISVVKVLFFYNI